MKASRDIEAELNMALQRAEKIDANFQVQPTPLDDWLEKFGIDPFSTQPKKNLDEDGGEIIDGKVYPKESTLRNPLLIKEWANALYKDKLELVVEQPDLPSHQIRAMLSVKECHLNILKYYPYIFECITANPMNPPYYMKMVNRMCDARQRIREGEDVDHVEAELQAFHMKYKKES